MFDVYDHELLREDFKIYVLQFHMFYKSYTDDKKIFYLVKETYIKGDIFKVMFA